MDGVASHWSSILRWAPTNVEGGRERGYLCDHNAFYMSCNCDREGMSNNASIIIVLNTNSSLHGIKLLGQECKISCIIALTLTQGILTKPVSMQRGI